MDSVPVKSDSISSPKCLRKAHRTSTLSQMRLKRYHQLEATVHGSVYLLDSTLKSFQASITIALTDAADRPYLGLQ